ARIRDVGRLEKIRGFEARRDAVCRGGGLRDRREPTELDALTRVAATTERLAVLLHVVLVDAERLCREPHALGAERARSERDRGAADDGSATRECSDAMTEAERVAADDGDFARGDAELAGGHL